MSNKDHIDRGNQYLAQARDAQSRADAAIRRGDRFEDARLLGEAHQLRGLAISNFQKAGVRLTPGGEPFGPDVETALRRDKR